MFTFAYKKASKINPYRFLTFIGILLQSIYSKALKIDYRGHIIFYLNYKLWLVTKQTYIFLLVYEVEIHI